MAETTCGACGVALPPLRYQGNPRKWCSEACRVWRHNHPGIAVKPRECEVCGEPLRPNAHRYCSDACGAEGGRDLSGRRRVETAGGEVTGRVFLSHIASRDHHVCGICGDRVDMTIAYPDAMSATLDHIVAVSDGGDHGPENVQLAHWLCNALKGDVPEGAPVPTLEGRTCTLCGRAIAAASAASSYCSKRCKKAVENARTRGGDPRVPVRSFTCAGCARECMPGIDGVGKKATRFCSTACKMRSHKARYGRMAVA